VRTTPRNVPVLLLGAALTAAVAMTLLLTRELTFLQDTWDFLIGRRDPTLDSLFQPHNEHLVVLPVLIEQLLLRAFGMTARPEYVLLALFLAATAALLFVYVRRRVGPWLALFAAILVLCLGPAWEALLWPFEITFVGPVLFGLAMLLALEREDTRGDVAACIFLVLSIGFSGLGLPFIFAAAVAVFQGDREARLRRLYVFLIPLALYIAWYAGWGQDAETHLSLHNMLASPRFVADSLAVAIGALAGLGTHPTGGTVDLGWGQAILAGLVVALGYRQLRKPGFPPGLWPAAAAAAAYWFLTAFNQIPGRDPTSSRYQYAGAIFVVLILANLLKGVRPGRATLLLAAVLTTLAVGPNLVVLKDQSDVLRQASRLTRADIGAIEIARRTVAPEFQLNPEVAGISGLVNIYAGPYLEAVDEYGSPAYTPAELASAPEAARRQADVVLGQALPITTDTQLGEYAEAGSAVENCVVAPPGGGGSGLVVSPGTTRIEVAPGPPAAFSLRRFAAAEFAVHTEGAPGNSTTLLHIPRDASRRPWRLQVEASQPVRVCR
jgi:hypothetical protein